MTILIPTGDLTGILGDVVPFASTDRDDTILNTIQVEWDGDMLHAFATDRMRIAWSAWTDADEPQKERQDDLFTKWGGADQPWKVTVCLDDVKDLIKIFQLGVKEYHTPLTIEARPGSVLKVLRNKESGHPAVTAAMPDQFQTFPDVRAALQQAAEIPSKAEDGEMPFDDSSRPAGISGVLFNAKYLADFAKVRPRGSLEMSFTGEHRPVLVAIGKRFQGAIQPVRPDSENVRTAAIADEVQF